MRELVLLDVVAAAGSRRRARTTRSAGDLADPASIERAVSRPTPTSVFHLAAVVSGQAEADFDIGMRVNLDATRAAARALPPARRAAEVRVRELARGVRRAAARPGRRRRAVDAAGLYGTQKAIGELLVYDMTRKGFIDGRSLRLPTVTVRPGKPNKAASSFASGIIREPLAGVDAICPVARDDEDVGARRRAP